MNVKANKFLENCHMSSPLQGLNNVIQGLVENSNTPTAKLTKFISMDPVLSARIHKLANDALNRNNQESGSLTKAITRLGLEKIRNLIQSNQRFISFSEELTQYITPTDFWQRSLAVALCAQNIDQILGNNSDDIFCAGLLHDYGRLIILNNDDKLPVLKLNNECRDKKSWSTRVSGSFMVSITWRLQMLFSKRGTFRR